MTVQSPHHGPGRWGEWEWTTFLFFFVFKLSYLPSVLLCRPKYKKKLSLQGSLMKAASCTCAMHWYFGLMTLKSFAGSKGELKNQVDKKRVWNWLRNVLCVPNYDRKTKQNILMTKMEIPLWEAECSDWMTVGISGHVSVNYFYLIPPEQDADW